MKMTRGILLVTLMLAVFALPAMARMDKVTSDRRMNEGFNAYKRGDLATMIKCHYEVAINDPTSVNGGEANRSLGDFCLRNGRLSEAKAWHTRVTFCSDPVKRSVGHQRLAGIAIKQKDMKTAAEQFLLAGECNPAIKEEMTFRAAKCYLSIAQANVGLRPEFKAKAMSWLMTCNSDAARAEVLGIRFENTWDAQAQAEDPTKKVDYSLDAVREMWLKWDLDCAEYIDRATDQDAKATMMLMRAEVYHDFLRDGGQVLKLTDEIIRNWQAHRKQAAWAGILRGGVYQDRAQYQKAITEYKWVVKTFTDNDNFDRNDVRGLARALSEICERERAKK